MIQRIRNIIALAEQAGLKLERLYLGTDAYNDLGATCVNGVEIIHDVYAPVNRISHRQAWYNDAY